MPETILEKGTHALPITIAKIKAQQAIDQASSTSGVEVLIDAGELTNEIPVDPPPPTE